jgi:hypothetical protein
VLWYIYSETKLKGRLFENCPTLMDLQVRMNDSFGDDDALDKKVDELEKALFKLLPEKEDLLRQDAAMSSSRHKFSNDLSTVTLYGKCTKALTFENL